jgi:hypothetical protein
VGTLRYRLRTDGLTWRTVGERVVVLDLASGRYFALNGSGSVLWHRLADGDTVDGLCDRVAEEFQVEPADARGDVEAFLSALSDRGMLLEV